jgi:rSAM/selenodomain-associated transferase 1
MNRLLLFARRPLRGRVKTRLVPALGEDRALSLYRAFLRDQLAFVRGLAGGDLDCWVCFDDAWTPDPEIAAELAGLTVVEQGPGDLGRRLASMFARAAEHGARAIAAIGADSPTLPATVVHEAFRRLVGGADAVVAPARDGGYVLVGTGAVRGELFRDVPWGRPQVLEVTRQRAVEAGIGLDELPSWYDVDDAVGLAALREELEDPAARRRAPATTLLLAGGGP